MPSFINYLLQVSLISLILLALFQVAFRKQHRFHLNRAYLLLSLLLSFALPVINLPVKKSLPEVVETSFIDSSVTEQVAIDPVQVESEPIILHSPSESIPIEENRVFPWMIIYFFGVGIVILRSLWVIARIIHLRIKFGQISLHNCKVVVGPDLPAFSFFNWIFMNEKHLQSKNPSYILDHEKAHVKQKHSVDLIIAELVQAVLWFNPLILLYKRNLKECHEYLADATVLSGGADIRDYLRSLQQEMLNTRYHKLASYFHGSTLKKRINMAIKSQNSLHHWLYLLILPMLIGSLYAFSFIQDPIQFTSADLTDRGKMVILIDPGHGGKDPGAINSELGVKEKDVVLSIAKAIKKQASDDFTIILTRKKDRMLSLEDRAKMVSAYQADFIVSLHLRSMEDSSYPGRIVTYYTPLNAYANQSFDIASWINKSVDFWEPGVMVPPQQAPFLVLRESKSPAILMELGNIQNLKTAEYFQRKENIKMVAAGILNSLSVVQTKIETTYPGGKITKLDEERQHNSFVFPLPQDQFIRVVNHYTKSRLHPILKINRPHLGVDLSAPKGTDVLSTDKGMVTEVKRSRGRSGYGTYVKIEHNNGIESFYAHLEDAIVEEGQKVNRSQVIGHVGNTGLTLSPHLHFEIRKDKKPVNPNQFIRGYINNIGSSYKIGLISEPPRIIINPNDIGPRILKMQLSFSEDVQWGQPEIQKIQETYYLFIENQLVQKMYAYELDVRGSILYVSRDKPAYQSGMAGFKIRDGKIKGPKDDPGKKVGLSTTKFGSPATMDKSKYPNLFPKHRKKFRQDSVNPFRVYATGTSKRIIK